MGATPFERGSNQAGQCSGANSGLEESYHWLDDLLTPLAMETSRQVEAAQKIGTQDVHSPGWVSAVDHLRMVFGLQKIDALPTKFRLQQLTTKHSAYS